MRARPLILLALVGALAATPLAHGAPAPQIVDPKGDSKGTADTDLASVTFSVTKKGRTLDKLVVSVTTAGAPALNPGSSYNVKGDVSGCGTFLLYSYWDATVAGPDHVLSLSGCGPNTDPTTNEPEASLDPAVSIKGNTLTYTVPWKQLPKEIKLKTKFSNLVAWTALAEPIIGFTAADFIDEPGATDWAVGKGTFIVK